MLDDGNISATGAHSLQGPSEYMWTNLRIPSYIWKVTDKSSGGKDKVDHLRNLYQIVAQGRLIWHLGVNQ